MPGKSGVRWDRPYFLPTRTLNALRRETLDRLLAARQAHRPLLRGSVEPNDAPFPEAALDYRGNVLNQYCLQHQLGLCDGQNRTRRLPGPLYPVDEQGHLYPLEFDCARCEMKVLY